MSEPMYDEDFLGMHKEQQRKELVGEIWQYAIALERYVVYLRNEVNTFAGKLITRLPYPDPESDFAVRWFTEFPAAEEFRKELEIETSDWDFSLL
ncbi:MAG: hypothetical protein KAH95_17125 [Spirochaetales bacterium]|nr:hypothetical protein [Spirochaetales bacterium]